MAKVNPYLLDETRQYCEVEFDVPPYKRLNKRDAKVLHIYTHVGGLLAKILRIGPGAGAGERVDVVGDLAMYRSMLMYEFDMSEPGGPRPKSGRVIQHYALALEGFKRYLEPRQHGVKTPESLISGVAVPQLHTTGLVLARDWSVDIEHAHRTRMHNPDKGLIFLDDETIG